MASFDSVSTDSVLSVSAFNDTDDHTLPGVASFSEFKWVQASTLPPVPWDKPPKNSIREPLGYDPDNPKVHPANTSTLFPITDAFLGRLRRDREKEAARARPERKKRKSKARAHTAARETAPKTKITFPTVEQSRRSARIAALNDRISPRIPPKGVQGNAKIVRSARKPGTAGRGRPPATTIENPTPKPPAQPRDGKSGAKRGRPKKLA